MLSLKIEWDEERGRELGASEGETVKLSREDSEDEDPDDEDES